MQRETADGEADVFFSRQVRIVLAEKNETRGYKKNKTTASFEKERQEPPPVGNWLQQQHQQQQQQRSGACKKGGRSFSFRVLFSVLSSVE